MASEVDIANLALSHLGDEATITTLYPSEGSPQADKAAAFYQIARDALLQEVPWTFSTRRVAMALLTSDWTAWTYTYARPGNCLKVLAITDEAGSLDNPGDYQKYIARLSASGVPAIYTSCEGAYAHYTSPIENAGEFPPLFVMTLSYRLAAMLAGPVLRGASGIAEAERCSKMAEYWKAQAVNADLNQRNLPIDHQAPWLSGR